MIDSDRSIASVNFGQYSKAHVLMRSGVSDTYINVQFLPFRDRKDVLSDKQWVICVVKFLYHK